jgi:hypothetical protein
VVVVTIPPPTLAQTQTVFHFPKEVQLGNKILPPGDYVITSLDVVNSGAVLTLARPESQSPGSGGREVGPQGIETPSIDDVGFFTVLNPRKQAVPDAEAQNIYLSACQLVEREFSRSEPVRPRLTLFLSAEKDSVYYPKREIRLRKWNKYKFAQGVVLLALDDLMPEGKTLALSKLAVLEVDSTVDVRALKSSRSWLPAAPHN